MKKYPKYKDSGVEWLGKVPEHWELVNLKFLLDYSSNSMRIGPFGSSLKSEFIKDKGFKVYGQEHVIKNDFSIGEKYVDEQKFEELKAYEIKSGDVLVTMMGTIGKCKVVPNNVERGIMDSHLIRIRFHRSKALSEFLSLIINDSDYIANNVKILSKGSIMDGLNSSIIQILKIVIPPKSEQQQILSYLDQSTARLDRFIALRQQQCALLKEQRAALIQQAVTKGIRPGVKMKDSGVEWIGEVPEGWEVVSLKFLLNYSSYSMRVGPFGSSLKSEYLREIGFKVYGQEHVIKNDFLLGEKYVDENKFEDLKAYEIKPKDILITMMGTIGKCKVVPMNIERGIMDSHLIRIRLHNRKVLPEFMSLIISDSEYIANNLNNLSKGSIMDGLNSAIIRNLKIVLPSKSEQRQILEYINYETAELDLLTQKYERQIDLMREYRASLIAAAVTGKIDVREN